jgi:hypothetical protein
LWCAFSVHLPFRRLQILKPQRNLHGVGR